MNDIIILLLLCFFTGIIVKYSDYLEDTKKESNIFIRILLGVMYGLLLFYTMYRFAFIIPLWMGIIFGLIISRKIDAPAHYTGVGITFLLFYVFNLSFDSLSLLSLFTIICVLEEFLNDYFDKLHIENKTIKKIISARPILEITALIVGLFIGNILIWIALLFHDIGYLLIANRFEK